MTLRADGELLGSEEHLVCRRGRRSSCP